MARITLSPLYKLAEHPLERFITVCHRLEKLVGHADGAMDFSAGLGALGSAKRYSGTMAARVTVLSTVAIGLLMTMRIGAAAEAQLSAPAACPPILIDGRAVSTEQRAHLCDGAAKARDFFRSHGINLKETIRLTIRNSERAAALPYIGCYSPGQKAIEMLSLEQALSPREGNTVFGLPIDEALYQSVVVHEIAHAIAHQHFAMPAPSLVAQEYLAYAAQLSTMMPQTRHRVLARYKVSPYEDIEQMSSVYYAMAPDQFGLKAYLHFVSLTDPSGFVRGLLSGSIRPERAEAQ